jgi:L(+)-tartrate dehydratase beta subunit
MTEKHLSTPINTTDLAELRIGDLVYLSGRLVTGRDAVYQRILGRNCPPPLEMAGLAIYHAGPIMRKISAIPPENPSWEAISAGPTTSMRMESCQEEFLELTGTRLIIGKGGMGAKTAEACRRLEAVHTVFPGGCAVLAAAWITAVKGVHWLDLGMGEAMWILQVRDFGPLIVSIDTAGNNLFDNKKHLFMERKDTALENLRPYLRYEA